MKSFVRNIVKSLSESLFPATCEVCGRALVDGEELICLACDYAMPRTHAHTVDCSDIHKRLAAVGLPVERTASYFYYYRDNPYARMIQRAKYNDRPEIANDLARRFAAELMADNFFDGIDLLQPIPLHTFKLLRRGYNQSEAIACGISEVTGIPITDNLIMHRHSTQTRKSAVERLRNVSGIVSAHHPEELLGKHLLLIDDIITTGATMHAALLALHAAIQPLQTPSATPAFRTSVLTLGETRLS